jgi:hypothetical protein
VCQKINFTFLGNKIASHASQKYGPPIIYPLITKTPMKSICILTCVLLLGVLGPVQASPVSTTDHKGLAPLASDAFATNSAQEDGYAPSLIGGSLEDLSVDKAKKKKKKKSHAS